MKMTLSGIKVCARDVYGDSNWTISLWYVMMFQRKKHTIPSPSGKNTVTLKIVQSKRHLVDNKVISIDHIFNFSKELWLSIARLRCIVLNIWYASLFSHSHWNTIHTYHLLQHVLSWFNCKTAMHCTQYMICISLLTSQSLKYHTYIPYITTRTQLIQLQDYDALYSIYDMHLSSYISHWNTIHTYHLLQHVLSWFIGKTTMNCTQYIICISLLTSHIEIPYIHTIYYNTYSVDSVARLRCSVLNIWYASLFSHSNWNYERKRRKLYMQMTLLLTKCLDNNYWDWLDIKITTKKRKKNKKEQFP